MTKKAIPIGIEFYREMLDKGYYYVDKTSMIKNLLESKAKITLFTRPRRFGKTLALNMLKTFFEDEKDLQGNRIDNHRYFVEKKIAGCGEEYMGKLGQYPVISLSLKSAKQPEFEMAYRALQNEIREEFRRHQYVCGHSLLGEDEEIQFRQIIMGEASPTDYATSLGFLSKCLKKYHHKNAIILIDEYDVPLENAYFAKFYGQMIAFIRSLFESALKTNENLEFAVITGCLRISRESIFTGLNNLDVNTVLSESFADTFGFTQPEVDRMLSDYGIADKSPELKEWYDGYLFGNTEIHYIYHTTVLSWFDKQIKKMEFCTFAKAIEERDCNAFGEFLSATLLETISFFDYAENYYHDFLVGLLKAINKYEVVSNRESGNGRPDIIMKSPSLRGKAFIMELKVAKTFQAMEDTVAEAVQQAVGQNYRAELEQEGYSDITIYGICFYKKECLVEAE